MAKNNETQVVDNIVQPRFYQVYGDFIESKEVMEPLSIISGTGPICGFDWVDTTKTDVTITSIFKADLTSLISGADRVLRNRSKRVFLSNKENKAGQVFNAYTTPDGLCHIAPDILTFNGVQPNGGWPSTSNPQKLVAFVVKASHTYKADGSENPPSVSNFTCNWLDIGTNTLNLILTWDYDRMITLLSDSGISFNKDIESIIGIYLIGWDPLWDSDSNSLRYKSIISTFKYQLCLIPYQGKFTSAPYGLNPMDIMSLKNRVKSMEDVTVPAANNLLKWVDTLQKSIGSNVEVQVSKTGTNGDNDIYGFTKLNIQGCTLVRYGDTINKEIDTQWWESSEAMGIIIDPGVNLSIPTVIDPSSWDICSVMIHNIPNSNPSYQLSNVPSDKLGWGLRAIILPQLAYLENSIIQSGIGFLVSDFNIDTSLAWRLARDFKQLCNDKLQVEVADSGKVYFTPTSGTTDHYMTVKVLVGISSLTIRVAVFLSNKGTDITGVAYNLNTLLSSNTKLSRYINDIIRLSDNMGTTHIYMSMPVTFKASDLDQSYSSSNDCEFEKYSACLNISNDGQIYVNVQLRGITKATGTTTYIPIGHEISLPISDKTLRLYQNVISGMNNN